MKPVGLKACSPRLVRSAYRGIKGIPNDTNLVGVPKNNKVISDNYKNSIPQLKVARGTGLENTKFFCNCSEVS